MGVNLFWCLQIVQSHLFYPIKARGSSPLNIIYFIVLPYKLATLHSIHPFIDQIMQANNINKEKVTNQTKYDAMSLIKTRKT